MLIKHKDYLTYDLPEDWCIEQKDDSTLIYNSDGEGAMTVSFYSVMEEKQMLENRICIMAKRFIDQNKIRIDKSLILNNTDSNKTILSGTGTTSDKWFIKIWVVARYPKVVFATYQSRSNNSEIEKCDEIVSSMKFHM